MACLFHAEGAQLLSEALQGSGRGRYARLRGKR